MDPQFPSFGWIEFPGQEWSQQLHSFGGNFLRSLLVFHAYLSLA
jgi:hypothetical protein